MELSVNQAFQKGVEAHKAGQVQEADRLYTAILEAQPQHPDTNHNMGVLAVGIGKIQEALPFFKTALEVNSNNAQFWLSYIEALIKLERIADAKAVLNQAKENNAKYDGFDKLEQRLVVLEAQDQDPPQDQFQPLINLFGQGKFQQALDKAAQFLHKFPNSVNLYNIIGAANAALGKPNAALVAYNKAVVVKPSYADSYNNIGVVLQDQGKLDEAIEAYNRAISIKPDYSHAYFNMANALRDQDKLEEAIKAYNKALTIKSGYYDATYNKGLNLKDQGKVEEAIETYNKALSIDPVYVEAHNNIGIALQDQGKLDEAIEAFKKALLIKPDYAAVLNNIGIVLRDQGKPEEAIETFNKALAIQPDNVNAQHMVSALKGETGSSVPRAYVEKLFDSYANKFESSLLEKLEYNVPKIMTSLIVNQHDEGSLGSILDLGCGTGLTGFEIRRFCSKLEGIDLSNSMLEKARIKNIYDNLCHTDIIEHLANAKLNFDYFISADVFIYVGELSQVFSLIKSRNKKPGKLVFSTEHAEKSGFHLETSGRYSHSKSYIEGLCKKFDYSISHFSQTNLRKEKGTFLTGGLYLLDF